MSQSSWPGASAWPTSSSWPSGITWPVAPFPSTVVASDIVAWGDFSQQMYSDIAGTTPQNTVNGPVGRVNEVAPLVNNWQASSVAQRTSKEASSLRSDFGGTNLPGQQMVNLGTISIPLNNATLVVVYLDRDGFGGPNMGLVSPFPTLLGAVGGGGQLSAHVNNAATLTGLPVVRGQKNTVVLRWTPTGLKCTGLTGGLLTELTVPATITGGSTGASGIALFNANSGSQGYSGSVAQVLYMNRAATDTEARQLAYWGDSKILPAGYPVTASLVGICGDSIARVGAGANANDGWPWVMQQTLRGGSFPTVELCNVAITGSGVSPSMYTALTPFYSPSRTKNVVILASGTNDLANGNTAAATTTALFSACAALRAQGWKVVVATCLPRSDTMAVSQVAFNSARATYNANIVAGSSNYDALADAASVTGMGADGDSNNNTNYSVDKIHPNGVGHRLLEPTYRAATSTLL